MGYLILVLVVIGLVILIVSFFKEDSFKQLEDQIENTSVGMIQELNQVKKKVRILEKELLIEDRER
ncbi:hypothetical protein JOD45_002598 [Scopulibacillus daqui]|uniref:BhlA-like holin n=1 Tax=Scopulibacillus daqui TaxID=1469162 RepID=A0ABS2Q254_9BACL|nr:hypothetical protein [Scopulibacillus daqui]MBM7646370.1 hypothetical protein [Scopulibacillus daqui]